MTSERDDRGNGQQVMPVDVLLELHRLLIATSTARVALAGQRGLSPLGYQAMKHLTTAASPLGAVALGRLVGMQSGSVTRLVNRLWRVGEIERHRDPRDRRRVILRPTSAALAREAREVQLLLEQTDKLLENHSVNERSVILGFLRDCVLVYRSLGERALHNIDGLDTSGA